MLICAYVSGLNVSAIEILRPGSGTPFLPQNRAQINNEFLTKQFQKSQIGQIKKYLMKF